jgi:hypothetical protein
MMQRYPFIAAAIAKPKPNKKMVTLVKRNVSNQNIFQTIPTEMEGWITTANIFNQSLN